MFCPQCKSEYRFGFTKCSDCGVDLVEHLDDGANAPAPTLEGDPAAMETLWAGTRDFTRQAIERALEATGIKYEVDGVESQLMPAFRDPITRIQVRRGDFPAAVAAIQHVGGEEGLGPRSPAAVQDESLTLLHALGINRDVMLRMPTGAAAVEDPHAAEQPNSEEALPEPQDDQSSDTSESDGLGVDFYPEDATSEVWSGDDAQMPQDIKACLTENRIACVVPEDGGKHRVMVLPADEARAKEIVREIVEESPPQ
jgi:hypothetical protein